MPRLELVGQSERDDDNRQGNTSRLLNFYREPLGRGGKSQQVLKGAPRANDFVTMPELFVRDMRQVDGTLFVLAGGTLYSVLEAGTVNALGNTVSADGAKIFGAEAGKVCTVSDGRYFVWNGTTMAEPAAGAFSGFGPGVYLNGYVVLPELDGRRFQWSEVQDAETLPGLNFATAESTDANLLRAMALQGRLLLFKEDAIEQWALTGQSGANAFQLLPGGVSEVGLFKADLAARFTGGVFFVGSNGIAYLMDAGGSRPISTPAVNTAIEASEATNCFVYEDEGHIFCALRFSDRPAWIYDIATGEWSERASGIKDPWNVTVTAQAYDKWFGGVVTGEVYRFSRLGTDEGGELFRTAVSNTLYSEGQRFRVPLVEITGRMGQGGLSDPHPPQVMLRFSRDGGLTWGAQRSRSLGGPGQYGQLCRIRGVGQSRQLAMEVRISDARDITLDASVNVMVA